MTALNPNHHHGGLITRRSIFIGAGASLICAPAVVRAASLMPIRRLIIASNPINPRKPIYMGFVDGLRLHSMEVALGRGWDVKRDGSMFGGISETKARNSVAYARTQGWLPTHGLQLQISVRILEVIRC
jgi:hypothetical protein